MSHPDGARPAPRDEILPVPDGTPTRTPWILAIIAMPLVSTVGNVITPATSFVGGDPTSAVAPDGIYLALQGVLGLIYLASIVFAFLDARELKRVGYERPFGWFWAILGALVYVIGRVVVVFRQSGRGLGLVWIFLAVFALSSVVSLIKATEVAAVVLGTVG